MPPPPDSTQTPLHPKKEPHAGGARLGLLEVNDPPFRETLFKEMCFIGQHTTCLTTPLTHNIQNNSQRFAQCKSNATGLRLGLAELFSLAELSSLSIRQKVRHVLSIAPSC